MVRRSYKTHIIIWTWLCSSGFGSSNAFVIPFNMNSDRLYNAITLLSQTSSIPTHSFQQLAPFVIAADRSGKSLHLYMILRKRYYECFLHRNSFCRRSATLRVQTTRRSRMDNRVSVIIFPFCFFNIFLPIYQRNVKSKRPFERFRYCDEIPIFLLLCVHQ